MGPTEVASHAPDMLNAVWQQAGVHVLGLPLGRLLIVHDMPLRGFYKLI